MGIGRIATLLGGPLRCPPHTQPLDLVGAFLLSRTRLSPRRFLNYVYKSIYNGVYTIICMILVSRPFCPLPPSSYAAYLLARISLPNPRRGVFVTGTIPRFSLFFSVPLAINLIGQHPHLSSTLLRFKRSSRIVSPHR